ncbi:hypothetical protein [Shewanella psychromarinicola]
MACNDLQHLCALSYQQPVINKRSTSMLSHTLMDKVGHLADSITT